MALVLTSRLGQIGAGGGVGTLSVTSSAFTPSNSSLLIASIGVVNGPAGGDVQTGLVVTGGGWTWTRRLGPNGGTISGYTAAHEIWTAPVTTGASMTINVAHAGINSVADPAHVQFNVVDITGYETSTPIGGTASDLSTDTGSKSITLSSSPATTSIVFASRLFQSNGGDSLATVGSGWTELYDLTDNGYASLQSQYRGSSTSSSVDWVDLVESAETSWLTSCLALEIIVLGGGGGGTTSPTSTYLMMGV